MKYQVGTKIMVKPDLQRTSFSFGVVGEMLLYRGRKGVVLNVIELNRTCYKISLDDETFDWDEEWLIASIINKGRG